MNFKYIVKRIGRIINWDYHKYLVDHHPRKVIDEIWLKEFGYTVDWNNPRDLNEKIEWLICYGDTTKWPLLADKYRVRDYITQKGYSHILTQLYGVWNDARKIDFSQLPQKFVLKCNHDYGSIFIIDKKKGFDQEFIINELNKKLKQKFGYQSCEPHYNKIKPLIIAEEYLESTQDTYSTSLIDYKVWCFNGKPYCIFTCYNRDSFGLETNVYDLNWNVHPEYSVFSNHFRDGKGRIPRPPILDKLLNAASVLSQDLPQARIDFYIVNGDLYFGEITLTSNCGRMSYLSKEYLIELGNFVEL